MKAIIIMVATVVSATATTTQRCQKTYSAIETLVKNSTITIEQAQTLWLKHARRETEEEV
jgi:hypothetical protein